MNPFLKGIAPGGRGAARWRFNILTFLLLWCMKDPSIARQSSDRNIGLVIHGGAGVILRERLSADLERQYRQKLQEAADTGYAVLRRHGHSLDAVEAVIRILEDSPLFNAGKGAVYTHEGTVELDASIMDGGRQRAGAVAAVKHIKNPITLARLVMEASPHVMMTGEGAEAFAREHGVELVSQDYFFTQRRWDELQNMLKRDSMKADSSKRRRGELSGPNREESHGTVGCVALDLDGNLAAGTSTGGMPDKRFGRVGDSPIIGAATYANNLTCAVSATGDGEYFIRSVVAHDLSARMEYTGASVQAAADSVIGGVGALGGWGGVIALDHEGRVGVSFNTPGMYRVIVDRLGRAKISIFREP